MVKRILLALALAVSVGTAVVACNNPSGTTSPSSGTGASLAPSLETSPGASDSMSSPEESMAVPSAS